MNMLSSLWYDEIQSQLYDMIKKTYTDIEAYLIPQSLFWNYETNIQYGEKKSWIHNTIIYAIKDNSDFLLSYGCNNRSRFKGCTVCWDTFLPLLSSSRKIMLKISFFLNWHLCSSGEFYDNRHDHIRPSICTNKLLYHLLLLTTLHFFWYP